jgi:hypothetical protein
LETRSSVGGRCRNNGRFMVLARVLRGPSVCAVLDLRRPDQETPAAGRAGHSGMASCGRAELDHVPRHMDLWQRARTPDGLVPRSLLLYAGLWRSFSRRRYLFMARVEAGNPQGRPVVLDRCYIGPADCRYLPCVLGHHRYPDLGLTCSKMELSGQHPAQ